MAQPGLGTEHKTKCGHVHCTCLVEPSQSYCSDWCAKHSDQEGSNEMPGKPVTSECRCGHPGCGSER